MASSNQKKTTVTLNSKSPLQLPAAVMDAAGEETSIAMLLLEESFRCKLLAAKEKHAREHNERVSAKRFSDDKELIEGLVEPVNMATDEISLECDVCTVETEEEMSVRFDGFNALVVHFIISPNSTLLLEGEVKGGVFVVTAFTLMKVVFANNYGQGGEQRVPLNEQDSEEFPEPVQGEQETSSVDVEDESGELDA